MPDVKFKSSSLEKFSDELLSFLNDILKNYSAKDKKSLLEASVVEIINCLNIPPCGATIQDFKESPCSYVDEISKENTANQNKYFVAPFTNISVSAVGPVFYYNITDKKLYTLLQRRVRDDFQWWFPGGYVELPVAKIDYLLQERGNKEKIKIPDFESIKKAIVDKYYQNIKDYGSWQKAKKEINNSDFVRKLFKENNISWPKELDFSWEDAWIREVKEETGVDVRKYKEAVILDFKTNKNFFIGTERDRIINIDGRFAANLGDIKEEPKTSFPADEICEVKWFSLEDIKLENKNYFLPDGRKLTPYTALFIEEALYKIICNKIKSKGEILNNVNKEKIYLFCCLKTLQAYIISQKLETKFKEILEYNFGPLEIPHNLCSIKGAKLYQLIEELEDENIK